MKRFVAPLIALAISGGLITGTVVGQEYYEENEGFNWFSDEAEAESEFGTGFEETGFGEEEVGLYEDEGLLSDDYGTYDSDYDWTTDDGWFDSWYGESDELF